MLPSSKLGIEMMRANSHDSMITGSESVSTLEPVTQVVTPIQEVQVEFPKLSSISFPVTPTYSTSVEDPGQGQPAMCTPPGLEAGDFDKPAIDVAETPRPNPAVFVDEDPTPRRPPVRVAERDDTMSPFPGGI
jgi:serine/threonine-protein kinase RIM15